MPLHPRIVQSMRGDRVATFGTGPTPADGSPDVVVVGAGPNGLTAAAWLARAGLRVLVLEANATWGGGARTQELTEPGFKHDTCSAVHPLGIASPVFRALRLDRHGLEWVHPALPLAHPLDGGDAVVLERSFDATCDGLGPDRGAWRRLLAPVAERWDDLAPDLLFPPHVPESPLLLARFGLPGLVPARWLAPAVFETERARAIFAGLAAHSLLALTRAGTSAFGMVLGGLAHHAGWPFAKGGSQSISDALAAIVLAHGGSIVTDVRVHSLSELPASRAVILDLTPRQVIHVASPWLPPTYRSRLGRYRYGPGVFKVDWALGEPIPWAADACRRAGTIHLGGTLSEIAACELAPSRGETASRPFVLLAQPSVFDDTRAPRGRHVAWGYCHVPAGWDGDATERIEAQVERFAPGFRDVIVARHSMGPRELERRNANLVDGDVNGGTASLDQLLTRPIVSLRPHVTPVPGLYLCSASTPPGGGVHGMGGYHAARLALELSFGRTS